jgi:hypothetical protein
LHSIAGIQFRTAPKGIREYREKSIDKMANTEGMPDEKLVSMLSINQSLSTTTYSSPQNDNSDHMKLHKSFKERQRMIDSFENGGDIQPSAKVIRASHRNRPLVKSSTTAGDSRAKKSNNISVVNTPSIQKTNSKKVSFETKKEINKEEKLLPPSVIKSDAIKERPIFLTSSLSRGHTGKKVSKFKMRQMEKHDVVDKTGTPAVVEHETLPLHKTGFPSFDLPVGSLTRRGILASKNTPELNKAGTENAFGARSKNSDTIILQADSIISNMTKEEIKESVAEIESILSPEMIQFLKNRKKVNTSTSRDPNYVDSSNNHKEQIIEKISSENNQNNVATSVEEKEKIGKILANIKSEEELDEVFAKTMGIGVDEMRPENESELEVATKLLRSTAHRQRILRKGLEMN